MEAQLVERPTENRKVGGSSPLRGIEAGLREFVAQG
jgi:hypothetical protein|tara:strand:+ start:1343 stop:1450 length:108 start_codon:yes stop_codon:yes gene_type:complete